MRNTTLIALALSFVLYVPLAFSQAIAKCEVSEELEKDRELYKKEDNWYYEMTGIESKTEVLQQKIKGFCLQKVSAPDSPTYWYSNLTSIESPMSLYIEVYENGDLKPFLAFRHPQKVEDYITDVNSWEKMRDYYDWVAETGAKNENVVLTHSWGEMKLEISIKILENGFSLYRIDWEKPEWNFLQIMSLVNESAVRIDGKSYKMNEKAKRAIGEMIYLWDNHFQEFQY